MAEKNYSVIQRECLSIVYALKQFRHYLLGCKFKLVTDHAPLQWLSSQKMEGLLARWALATQEYDFTITYHRGVENGNLSRHPGIDLTATVSYSSFFSAEPPKALPSDQSWYQPPLRRYRQL